MRSFFRSLFILTAAFVMLFHQSLYAWTEYKNIRYLDLDGDSTNEIIMESNHGAGLGHYIEEVRVFKDIYPELQLIFQIRTIDEYFSEGHHYKVVSKIDFSEPQLDSGFRDITVISKKIYFKDKENKIVSKEDDLGAKVFKWNGEKYL